MRDAYAILMGPIGTELAERVLTFLREKVSDHCERIHLAIQSHGGSVPIALSLANLFRALPCQLTTYNIGNVDSAAIVLYAAGNDRLCAPEAVFCVHPISKKVEGAQTLESLSALLREIEQDTERVTGFLSGRTPNTTQARWKELMAKPCVIDADMALKAGLANGVEVCGFAFGQETCGEDGLVEVLVEHAQSAIGEHRAVEKDELLRKFGQQDK